MTITQQWSFVVYVLMTIFDKPKIEATSIMLHVHRNGRGLAGVYLKEIAETKAAQVESLARAHGFPLNVRYKKMINKDLQIIITATVEDAIERGHQYLTVEHLVYAILHDDYGVEINKKAVEEIPNR